MLTTNRLAEKKKKDLAHITVHTVVLTTNRLVEKERKKNALAHVTVYTVMLKTNRIVEKKKKRKKIALAHLIVHVLTHPALPLLSFSVEKCFFLFSQQTTGI